MLPTALGCRFFVLLLIDGLAADWNSVRSEIPTAKSQVNRKPPVPCSDLTQNDCCRGCGEFVRAKDETRALKAVAQPDLHLCHLVPLLFRVYPHCSAWPACGSIGGFHCFGCWNGRVGRFSHLPLCPLCSGTRLRLGGRFANSGRTDGSSIEPRFRWCRRRGSNPHTLTSTRF